MKKLLRRLIYLAHIISSAAWLGAVLAYIAIAVAGLTSEDARLVSSAYLIMKLVGWTVIAPASVATLLTGFIQAVSTEWGLVRHAWVLTKLVLASVATVILFKHLPRVSEMADLAMSAAAFGPAQDFPRTQLLVHAAGGLAVLLFATWLSVWKPWGKTRFARHTAAPT